MPLKSRKRRRSEIEQEPTQGEPGRRHIYRAYRITGIPRSCEESSLRESIEEILGQRRTKQHGASGIVQLSIVPYSSNLACATVTLQNELASLENANIFLANHKCVLDSD